MPTMGSRSGWAARLWNAMSHSMHVYNDELLFSGHRPKAPNACCEGKKDSIAAATTGGRGIFAFRLVWELCTLAFNGAGVFISG